MKCTRQMDCTPDRDDRLMFRFHQGPIVIKFDLKE